jgi:signal transduction histidine kinase
MPGETPPKAGRAANGGIIDSDTAPARRAARVLLPASRRLLQGTAAALAVLPTAALAQERVILGIPVGTLEVMQAAIFAGVMGAALVSAIWLIRERARTSADNAVLRGRVADLGAALQRSEALLNMRDQRVVVWAGDHKRPEVIGALPMETGAPDDRSAFLAFGRWLMPRSATALEHSIVALRERSRPFDLVVETLNGSPIETQGRQSAQHAIVRFSSLTDTQRMHARLKLEHQRLAADHETILGLINALRMPFWLRGSEGRLRWVNQAFASSVEAESADAATRDGKEFLSTQSRDAIADSHKSRPVFQQTLSTVVNGDRRVFAVTDVAGVDGSAGLACDVSEIDTVRADFERMVRSHADTLNHLNTAVAIFDTGQKLRFFNQALQKLWDLDHAFLDSAPDNALLLDRLRSEGKIPEQPEWRRWKDNVLAAYRAVEPVEDWWYLPDGRTIRVMANPQPRGGVTWVFENLTEKIDLESRYQTAVRVQGETLDNLAEGVAVFGSDGRVRLSNAAFASLWGLDASLARPDVHISAIRAACAGRAAVNPWEEFVAAVTGFDDERRDRSGQADLVNGSILRYALINLPNGQVMITFVDVTDSVNVERALKEKNEALQRADQLKTDFVQHVSYELRSPLTNIIGFTELLEFPATGPLNERQREYVDHIGSSSAVLLTFVNDILDLANVDAGIMELDIGEVRVEHTINAAAELVADRLREHSIALKIDTASGPKSFHGDENRIRQILFNLLSNAANYAPAGTAIELKCVATSQGVEFSVHDDGPGMPRDLLDAAFRRFETWANGGRRRGAGLGLSIVKSFVELHGGTVGIETGPNGGTTVICRFPLSPSGARAAAE